MVMRREKCNHIPQRKDRMQSVDLCEGPVKGRGPL